MRKLKRLSFILLFCLGMHFQSICVEGNDTISAVKDTIGVKEKIEQLANQVEALNSTIDITVSNVSIQEFVRSVANLSGLNINVAPELNFTVINNFTKVRVADLLIFLCQQYNLEISAVGNIIDLFKTYKTPKPLKGVIEYNKTDDLISMDFQNIPLNLVTRQIVIETGKNVFAEPTVLNQPINIFLQKLPFESAIENLTKSNTLELEKNSDGSYFIKGVPAKQESVQFQQQGGESSYNQQRNQSRTSSRKTGSGSDGYELNITKLGKKNFSIVAVDAPVNDIIKEVSKQLGINYYLIGDFTTKSVVTGDNTRNSNDRSSNLGVNTGNVTLTLTNIEYEDLLNGLFFIKDVSYIKDGDAYIIGDKSLNKFKSNRIIKIVNRPVDSLIIQIPDELKEGLNIKEFKDLNSLIVSGNQQDIKTFEDFCKQLDKVVPVIMIEVLIVDIKKTTTTATGIEAGLGEVPDKTTGKLFPEVDVNLSTKAINNLIQKFNGLGVANLGNVSKDFYLSIKALESDGILKIRSTPVLSTINGHKAKINIGKTEYYLVESSNVSSGQTPVISNTKSYNPVEAKLEVLITPTVSGDEQITLDINVSQSDFTERIDKFAPPGKVNREFVSKIRVKNQDMILLGGLEELSNRETSSGVPLLQRIPILKWIFSSRSKTKSDSKLNIFIRPTIIG